MFRAAGVKARVPREEAGGAAREGAGSGPSRPGRVPRASRRWRPLRLLREGSGTRPAADSSFSSTSARIEIRRVRTGR